MTFAAVPRPALPPRWVEFADRLECLLNKDKDADLFDLLRMWRTEEVRWWVRGQSAAVTQVMLTPRRRIFLVWLYVGVLDDLDDMLPMWQQAAKEERCDALQMRGRKGWAKVLRSIGASEKHLVMELPVRSGYIE